MFNNKLLSTTSEGAFFFSEDGTVVYVTLIPRVQSSFKMENEWRISAKKNLWKH